MNASAYSTLCGKIYLVKYQRTVERQSYCLYVMYVK